VLSDLVRYHHQDYDEDLSFWISQTSGKDPVLELGAGHGRVSLPLTRAGRQVYALDYSEYSLYNIKNASRDLGAGRVFLVAATMQAIPFIGEFGAIIIPCNTYSLFGTEERKRLLNNIFSRLYSGGLFIASIPNPRLIDELYHELRQDMSEREADLETSFIHPDTGFPVQVSSLCSSGDKSVRWEWIYDHLLPDGTTERFIQVTEHQLSTLDQYRQEIINAGFKPPSFLGAFDGSPYQKGSDYLILQASKS
jgi:SAM-dependent methyltransferase